MYGDCNLVRRLRIAIDIDDVLTENAIGFVAFSNERWGTRLRVDDYSEHWSEMWHVDSEEAERRAHVFHDSGAIKGYAHIGGAEEVLRNMSQVHHLMVATSRRLQVQSDTLLWIEEHFPGVFASSAVYFSGLWDTVYEDSHKLTKTELITQINADVLIDDQLKHCLAVSETGRNAILFGDYTWNRADSLPDRVVRCHSWSEVEVEIERIANS